DQLAVVGASVPLALDLGPLGWRVFRHGPMLRLRHQRPSRRADALRGYAVGAPTPWQPLSDLETVVWPLRSTALPERAGSDRVRVASREHRERVLGLLAQPLLVGEPDIPDHRLLVGADRALGQRGDLVGELDRALERLALRHHLVREPDPKRLLGADLAAGDDQLHRARVADGEVRAPGHAVAADDVPAALERAEDGVLGGDPDVGEQRVLEAGGDGPAVHRRDHRLEDVNPARVAALARRIHDAGPELVPVRPARLPQLPRVLQ